MSKKNTSEEMCQKEDKECQRGEEEGQTEECHRREEECQDEHCPVEEEAEW